MRLGKSFYPNDTCTTIYPNEPHDSLINFDYPKYIKYTLNELYLLNC